MDKVSFGLLLVCAHPKGLIIHELHSFGALQIHFYFRKKGLIISVLCRRATDLEPLQPLLKKFIGFLETEGLPPAAQASRPRAQLERLSIWLGITSL